MLPHIPQRLQVHCDSLTELLSFTQEVRGPRMHDGTRRPIAKEESLCGACRHHQSSTSFDFIEKFSTSRSKGTWRREIRKQDELCLGIELGRHCLSPLSQLCSVCKGSHRFNFWMWLSWGTYRRPYVYIFLQHSPRAGTSSSRRKPAEGKESSTHSCEKLVTRT